MKRYVSYFKHSNQAGDLEIRCPRCTGHMVYEAFEDLRDDTGNLYFYGWRCLFCGEIIDPIILANRKNKPQPVESKTRKRLVFR